MFPSSGQEDNEDVYVYMNVLFGLLFVLVFFLPIIAFVFFGWRHVSFLFP